MSYDFSFDKKSAIAIIAGCLLVGVLLFAAGFLVGKDRGSAETRAQLEQEYSGKLAAVGKPATKPATADKPAADDSASAAKPDAEQKHSEVAAAPPNDAKPAATVAEAKPASAQPPAASPAASLGATQPPASSANSAGTQTASATPVAASGSPASATASAEKPPLPQGDGDPPAPLFSVQLGAFQSQENAKRLIRTLRSRGYDPFAFDTLDAGGKIWYTVRIGHYADPKKASHDAAILAGKEQIAACVRSDSQL